MKVKSDKLKLSVSAIKTYQQCPRKYYYTYIDKKPKKDWAHLKLGNFVHDALENFHKTASKENTEMGKVGDVMSRVCKAAAHKYGLSPEQRASAKEMLSKYLEKVRKTGMPKVIQNEKSFAIDLGDDVTIRGFIDRVDEKGASIDIVDYKTGKSKYLDEFQLTVYALAVFHEYPDLNSVVGKYDVLAENSREIPYPISRTDTERCKDTIRKVASQIREEKSWEPKPTRLCSYCDFEAFCPATKKERGDW